MDEKPAKKSETLEVRLTFESKQALMARARIEGRAASEIIRSLIDQYLASPAITQVQVWESTMTKFRRYLSPTTATLLIGSLSLAFAFSAIPTRAEPDLKAAFETLDSNDDGFLSISEFEAEIPAVTAGPDTERLWPQKDTLMTPAQSETDTVYFVFPVGEDGGGPPSALAVPVTVPFQSEQGSFPAAQHFQDLDLSTDGVVSFEEYEWHHGRILLSAFEALDIDGDKGISEAEVSARNIGSADPSSVLVAFDHDSNGLISVSEFTAGSRH